MKYENRKPSIPEIKIMLDSLCIYRNLLNDPVIYRLYSLLSIAGACSYDVFEPQQLIRSYAEFFNCMAAESKDMDLRGYITEKIIYDENPFSTSMNNSAMSPDSYIFKAVEQDLLSLQNVASIASMAIKDYILGMLRQANEYAPIIKKLPDWECSAGNIYYDSSSPDIELKKAFSEASKWSDCIGLLKKFHENNGTGDFARCRAFIWQHSNGHGKLVPVINPDPVTLSDLIDYELERQEVIKNTELFLEGYPANNVLLYGDRGTGKSSTVKAILNKYYPMGLRLIEVPKHLLVDFHEIISALRHVNLKFILFVDDLAFEDNEENYTALKAVLEGSMEAKPQNVLIYATSNRRHLIKERFSDRVGLQFGDSNDEVRAYDTIQEKLSLADRFGITVVFSSPDKEKFLHIVEELASREGISMSRDELDREALKWEMWHNGRSPRTARQFITWLKGNNT